MRKIYLVLFIFILSALLHPWASLAQKKCLCLTWAFIVAGVGGPDRVLDVTKQPVIHSGERLRIVIQINYGDLYLLFIDSHGELTVLHSSFHAQGKIELPREGEWYTVDQSTGMDTFYLLAVYYPRLDSLAKALQIYVGQPKSAEAKAAVLEEFEKARRSYSEPHVQERGIPIEGTIGEATSVTADNFYTKTVRFRHE